MLATRVLAATRATDPHARCACADDRRDPNWLEWSEAQEARAKAEAVYKALPATTPHAKKMLVLREWLLIALHTCMPCVTQALSSLAPSHI